MREVPDCWEELEHSLELEPDERVEAVVDVPVDEEPENLYSSEESLTYLPHPTEWIVPSNTWKEQEELLPIEESFENIPANLGHQSILRAAESLKGPKLFFLFVTAPLNLFHILFYFWPLSFQFHTNYTKVHALHKRENTSKSVFSTFIVHK